MNGAYAGVLLLIVLIIVLFWVHTKRIDTNKNNINLVARLTTQQVVPPSLQGHQSGTLEMIVDRDSLVYKLYVTSAEKPIKASIHIGDIGENGDQVYALNNFGRSFNIFVSSGIMKVGNSNTERVLIDTIEMEELLKGNRYVEVILPSGMKIRGQIRRKIS